MQIRPDLVGYEEAQNRAREFLGVPVVLFGPIENTWPAGTPVDPLTGLPVDPLVEPESTAQASALVHGKVAFHAARGGRFRGSEDDPMGVMDQVDTMLILASAYASAATLVGAESFEARGWHCQIDTFKFDGVAGIDRLLIYGKRISEARP